MATDAYAGWVLAGGVAGGLVFSGGRVAAGRGPGGARRELGLWALSLIGAAVIYVGFAVFGRAARSWVGVELAGVLAYGGLAALGMARWPGWVALGWWSHMLWDTVVQHGGPDGYVPPWYPPLCLGFDAVVGLRLLLLRRRPAGAASSPSSDAGDDGSAAPEPEPTAGDEGLPDPEDPVPIPIDGTLDLHAFRPRDLRTLVPDYLAECRARGILEVRVVHGKGRGQLRRSVHAILERQPIVARFRLAPPERGGWGATLVDLRPPRGGDA